MKEDGVYTLTASNSLGETIATANLKVNGKISVRTFKNDIVLTDLLSS
jgi:hypothetical protein